LIVGGNAYMTHYTIGLEVHSRSRDNTLAYSLVVGGNLTWTDGSLHPDGSGNPYVGAKEDAFVGGSLTLPQDLLDRVGGTCGEAGPNCLKENFDSAYTCYKGYSDAFANAQANANATIQYGGLLLTCFDNNQRQYVANVDVDLFNSITYYTLNNCNFQAQWVLNIIGTGTVNVTGGSFPSVPGSVVYNVIGARTIIVDSTGVQGAILGVDADLWQTNSVIVGKVVVKNFLYASQTNRFDCLKPGSVVITSFVTSDAEAGSTTINVGGNQFIAGDTVTINGKSYAVIDVSANTIIISPALDSSVATGSTISVVVSDSTVSRTPGRSDGPLITGAPRATNMEMMTTQPNSASTLTILVALIAIILQL